MKVIGKSEKGFILEALESETSRLIGYYGSNPHVKVGSEINVHAMYQQMYKMKRMKDDIDETKQTLKEILKNLDLINPLEMVCPTGGEEE